MERREWLLILSLRVWRAAPWAVCVDYGAHKLHFSCGGLDFPAECTPCRRWNMRRAFMKGVFARDPLRYRSSQKTCRRWCMSGFDADGLSCCSIGSFFPTFPWLCPFPRFLVDFPCHHHLFWGFQLIARLVAQFLIDFIRHFNLPKFSLHLLTVHLHCLEAEIVASPQCQEYLVSRLWSKHLRWWLHGLGLTLRFEWL